MPGTRIHIAAYQTLGVDTEEADANFLTANYPEDFFSHIIIDECHRSAWGKWSQVLTRNPSAVQIGLTATPRQLTDLNTTTEDEKITADNRKYFGEPVYEYDMAQGMEDGYLAAREVIQRDIFLDKKTESEQVTGVQREELENKEIRDAITGAPMSISDVPQPKYEAGSFEARLLLPDRVLACAKIFLACWSNQADPNKRRLSFAPKTTMPTASQKR